MEIHCAVAGQGRSGDLEWRKCVFVCFSGVEMLINAKLVLS